MAGMKWECPGNKVGMRMSESLMETKGLNIPLGGWIFGKWDIPRHPYLGM